MTLCHFEKRSKFASKPQHYTSILSDTQLVFCSFLFFFFFGFGDVFFFKNLSSCPSEAQHLTLVQYHKNNSQTLIHKHY